MAEAGYESTGIDAALALGELIGGGRRYEVYRAWDRAAGREVAVKALRPSRTGDALARVAFAREVRIAARLDHPGLVHLLSWRDGPRPYLVLELVDAPTLSAHLERRGSIGVPEACVFGLRILGALQHLHAHGIAHLDLKPANVTIGDPPRLLDLGSAREVPAMLGRPVGTAAYMSPEQCRGGEVTTASDLFGLGATLYEALTGLRAFSAGDPSGREPKARFPQLVEEAQPLTELLPFAPRRLAALVHACLASDPRERPSTGSAATELRRTLVEMGLGQLARTEHDEIGTVPIP